VSRLGGRGCPVSTLMRDKQTRIAGPRWRRTEDRGCPHAARRPQRWWRGARHSDIEELELAVNTAGSGPFGIEPRMSYGPNARRRANEARARTPAPLPGADALHALQLSDDADAYAPARSVVPLLRLPRGEPQGARHLPGALDRCRRSTRSSCGIVEPTISLRVFDHSSSRSAKRARADSLPPATRPEKRRSWAVFRSPLCTQSWGRRLKAPAAWALGRFRGVALLAGRLVERSRWCLVAQIASIALDPMFAR
jgi:hypothetical protein